MKLVIYPLFCWRPSVYLAQIKLMLDAEEEYMLQKIGKKMVIFNLHINYMSILGWLQKLLWGIEDMDCQ